MSVALPITDGAMCSIAIEKSCRVALNVIGNIAHSTCYHSFLLDLQILTFIFVI